MLARGKPTYIGIRGALLIITDDERDLSSADFGRDVISPGTLSRSSTHSRWNRNKFSARLFRSIDARENLVLRDFAGRERERERVSRNRARLNDKLLIISHFTAECLISGSGTYSRVA